MNKLQHLQYLGKLGNQGKVAITDSDARTYISAVETADNQSLEFGVKVAIQNFIVGAKADGIWDAIKSSAILAGARTLSGALVPLKGTAPTNFNFVSGDYNRKTGLVGDGSTKYLNSNRAGNADPLNSYHLAVNINSLATSGLGASTPTYLGAHSTSGNSASFIRENSLNSGIQFLNKAGSTLSLLSRFTGFNGTTRTSGVSVTNRAGGTNTIVSSNSIEVNTNLYVFADNFPSPTAREFTNGRLTFYSIGESLNLALLDTRVTKLMTDLGNAIP